MITLTQARTLLRDAVKTKGRFFRYVTPDNPAGCFYEPIPARYATSTTDPRLTTGCLIGTALTLAGESFHRSVPGGSLLAARIQHLGKDYATQDALLYWTVAQNIQDSGCTWGEAYTAAEAWAIRHGHPIFLLPQS